MLPDVSRNVRIPGTSPALGKKAFACSQKTDKGDRWRTLRELGWQGGRRHDDPDVAALHATLHGARLAHPRAACSMRCADATTAAWRGRPRLGSRTCRPQRRPPLRAGRAQPPPLPTPPARTAGRAIAAESPRRGRQHGRRVAEIFNRDGFVVVKAMVASLADCMGAARRR